LSGTTVSGTKTHKFERIDVQADPGRKLPGEDGFGVGILARPQCGGKGIDGGDDTRCGIVDRDGVPGVVDEEPLSRLVVLEKHDIGMFRLTVSIRILEGKRRLSKEVSSRSSGRGHESEPIP
jgi:hypothetical protein